MGKTAQTSPCSRSGPRLASSGGRVSKAQHPLPVPQNGATFLIGGERSKASGRSWPRQAGHFPARGSDSSVPAVLDFAVVVGLPRRRAGRDRTYLQPGRSCGRGSPGASQTGGLSTPGTRGVEAPASQASRCLRRPRHFPWTPRPVSRVTSSNRALGPPLVL